MRLLACVAVLVLVVSAVSAGKGKRRNTMLLGADDVDKTVAESQRLPPVDGAEEKPDTETAKTPSSLREAKELTREDKRLIKQLQERIKTLKTALKDGNTSKSDKKKLKKQFRDLKSEVHSKRNEFNHLKAVKNEMKKTEQEQKKQPGRKGGENNRKKGQLVIADDTVPETITTTTTTTTPAPTTPKAAESETAELLTLSKADRKALRKAEKRKNKKNKNLGIASPDDMLMQGDDPMAAGAAPTSKDKKVKLNRGGRTRPQCTQDSDCSGSAICATSESKGTKFCRMANNDKPAGKKCRNSEQCARGLQCFVTLTAEEKTHKKHPRRGKKKCADPLTTDSSKGHFIPFKTIL